MSEKIPLTVITVCYNEKEVERTCKSIINQTFQNFEWIVIDGGSNKETLETLNKYKNRMNIFVSEKDTGIYNAMNKGIALSEGKWLNFMNAGDTFFEDETLEKIFVKNILFLKDTDVIYCDSFYHGNDGSIKAGNFPEKLNYAFWNINCINHQAAFIKKALFEKFGTYDEQYKICADCEKFLQFQKEGCKFKHLKITASNFFLNGCSNVHKRLTNFEKGQILNKYFPFKYETVYTLDFFDKFPLLRIKKRRDNEKFGLIFLKMPIFTWNVSKQKK